MTYIERLSRRAGGQGRTHPRKNMKYVISFGLFSLLAGLNLGCSSKNASPSGEKGTDAPAVANSETAEEALKGLAGNWQVASIQNLPPGDNAEYIKKLTARIEGKMIKLSEGFGYFDQGEIRLDPTKSPKQFDLISLDKAGKPRMIEFYTTGSKQQERSVAPVLGIYSHKGDHLTVALTDRDGYRPTEFKSSVMENTGGFVTANKRGSTYVVIVELNRVGSSGPVGEESPKQPKTDKELVESVVLPFLASLKAGNLDKALQDTDLPFLGGFTGEQRRIESKDALQAELKQFVDKWGKSDEFPTDVHDANHWEPQMFSGVQSKYFEAMRAATGPEGFYVALGTKLPNGGLSVSGKRALVKFGHGKPKIVGLFSN